MPRLLLTENRLHPTVGKSENIRQNTMNELNRRDFLLRAGTGLSAAWVTANWPAILSAATHAHNAAKAMPPPKYEFFTPEEAAEIEAITARLIPTDDTPGAREAGVVYFIDRKSTRLNSSHGYISYAVFCLKNKNLLQQPQLLP